MPDALTPTYMFVQPTIGAAENTWGKSLNDNLAMIDTLLSNRVVKSQTGLDSYVNDPQVITSGLRLQGQLDGVLAGSGQGVYQNSAATARWVETRILAQLNAFFPVGTILLWSGTRFNIPAGWALCNGSYGTPDLSDRIVLACSGGAPRPVLNEAGNYAGVIQQKAAAPGDVGPPGGIGWHQHGYGPVTPFYTGNAGNPVLENDYGTPPWYWPGLSAVGGGSSPNLPYYVMCYIMKWQNWTAY
jgi:hypothetical protein